MGMYVMMNSFKVILFYFLKNKFLSSLQRMQHFWVFENIKQHLNQLTWTEKHEAQLKSQGCHASAFLNESGSTETDPDNSGYGPVNIAGPL